MTYSLKVSPRAERSLAKIPKSDRSRIGQLIEGLKKDPRPVGCKKLKGATTAVFRVRKGDWRVLYTIEDNKLVVLVVDIGHRKDVYKER